MITSDAIDQVTTALVAFHDLVEPITKNAQANAGARSYKYADLAAVWAAIRGPLASTGLAVVQTFEPAATDLVLERVDRQGQLTRAQALAVLRTRLVHQSGQWIESTLPVVADWSDPQRLGSCVTYLRRYSLLALLALACEDDDGHAARTPSRDRRERETNPPRAMDIMDNHGQIEQSPSSLPTAHCPLPTPRRPAPRTGPELYAYATTCRTDPALTHWIGEAFPRYPHRLKTWSDSQVAAAWPAIREHLLERKAQRNGHAAIAGVPS